MTDPCCFYQLNDVDFDRFLVGLLLCFVCVLFRFLYATHTPSNELS